MIDWNKRADKISDIIENITNLSMDFLKISEKVQEQIDKLENKKDEKDKKEDERLLPSLRNLRTKLESFDGISSGASSWFLVMHNDLTRMATFFDKLESIRKDYNSSKASGAIDKGGSKLNSIDSQLTSATSDIDSLKSSLEKREQTARDLVKVLFSYVQTYVKELSNIGRINSRVASSIGIGDTNKHLEKLVKALGDYASS